MPQHASEGHGKRARAEPALARKVVFGAVVILLIFAVIAAPASCAARMPTRFWRSAPMSWRRRPSTVAPAKPGAPTETLVLPGNVTAYTDSPIYARTDGYLQRWYYDIGAKVKKGRSAGGD